MKAREFKNYLVAFKNSQDNSRSPIVAESVIRKFGGGRGHEIKTLYITYAGVHRDGEPVPANAWMGNQLREPYSHAKLGHQALITPEECRWAGLID